MNLPTTSQLNNTASVGETPLRKPTLAGLEREELCLAQRRPFFVLMTTGTG